MKTRRKSHFEDIATALFRHYGLQNWWPAASRFEVIVGAYLTQNTNWTNVEKALANLKRAQALSVDAVRRLPMDELATLVRPSGYYLQKAARLKNFVAWLDADYGGSLDRMFAQPTAKLRAELLALNGVGHETADKLLLYAGGHEIAVVDAYMRRVLARHAIMPHAMTARYDDVRAFVEERMRPSAARGLNAFDPRHRPSRMSRARRSELAQSYSELHAVLVRVGSEHCRAQPRCDACPLKSLLPADATRITVKL